MEAIVLAGGFGTRLREAVPDLPKPMAPIGDRPFLEIQLTSLARKGFSRIILSLGFMAEVISDYFGPSFLGMELDYVVENQPLGTGGAVRLAMSKCREDHVYIFNGDTFLDLEVDALEALWLSRRQSIIVGRNMPDTLRYGRLLVSHEHVKGFTEKGMGGPGLINAGCYVFALGCLNHYEINEPFSLEVDYLSKAVRETTVICFATEGLFIDIGIPADYLLAQNLLMDIN